ncbi:hypothetical protein B9Z55_011486 [Caenorhabditis nigoni]|uniref:Homeobox domain-containing protein n=1 Tax=Caenorhabditis nigoni TaxID=1611254 RepID=A0A2G5UKC8_9PELO|nr:hypothetical protein B9Z55_011486 [Caenorhabditis nigoni]
MASNQPSSSNSALDSTFLVYDEDYVSELRARLIDSASRFGTVDPLSMMSLLEAERQLAESKKQNSEAGNQNTVPGTPSAQPVQAPDQDYFYDKYLTSSVRTQMAKRLNMTDQELETFLQNRRSEEKRLLDQFKDENSSTANHPGSMKWNFGIAGSQPAESENQRTESERQNSGAENQNVEGGNQNPEIASQKTDSGAQNTESGNLSSQKFSPEQVQALRQKYLRDPYPSPSDRKELAESIDLTEKQVKYWFHDKRFEDRIAHKQSEKWSANRHGIRRTYLVQQVEAMEKKFAVKPFLTFAERRELAESIGLKESEVKKWFQDRRDDEKYKEDVETDPDFSDSESDYDYDMDESMEQYPKKFSCQSNKRDRDTNANRSVLHHAEAEHQSLGGLPNQGFYPYRSYATAFPSYWYPQLTNSDRYYTCNPLNSYIPFSGEVLRQKLDSGNRDAESGIQNSGAENQNVEGGNQNSEITSQKTDSGAQNTESGNLSSRKFSPEQVQALEHQYVRCPYLSPSERKQLAESISLTEKQVKYWFHDQRSEGRRLGMQYAKCSANRHCISRTYLAQQVKVMEQKFAVKQFLTLAERKELAESIGLEESEVKEWFQDRRESEEDKEDGESDFHSDSDYDYDMDESMEQYPNEFSCQQVEDLEQQFANNKYLTRDVRKELAKSNNLTERQVKTWFQDRRFDEIRVKGHSNKEDRDTNGELLLQKLDSLEHKVTSLLAKEDYLKVWRKVNIKVSVDGFAFDDNMSSLLARLNAGNGDQNSGIRKKLTENFSLLQSQALEQQFAINNHLTPAIGAELARWTNLTPAQVNIWFQDRRLRQNREEQKEKDIDSFVKNYVNLPDASKPLSSFEARKIPKEFTRQQVEAMEQKFIVKQCLTLAERKELAKSIGLKESEVKTWFQNRREEEEDKEDSFSELDKLLEKALEVKNEKSFLYEMARRNVSNFCKVVVPWALLMIFACMIAIKLTVGIECRRNDYH